jgi:hypothetical protein
MKYALIMYLDEGGYVSMSAWPVSICKCCVSTCMWLCIYMYGCASMFMRPCTPQCSPGLLDESMSPPPHLPPISIPCVEQPPIQTRLLMENPF